ncbi:hypothetical protein M3Y94_00402600 [Aphelenchoides besseyi]|nr:hypothetical protein M3Y94_00402600 [Aphelenchoides besseyi]KAI6218435.1 hypothetical protein M3Y95_01163800 [Aphelenchoides besseyi]
MEANDIDELTSEANAMTVTASTSEVPSDPANGRLELFGSWNDGVVCGRQVRDGIVVYELLLSSHPRPVIETASNIASHKIAAYEFRHYSNDSYQTFFSSFNIPPQPREVRWATMCGEKLLVLIAYTNQFNRLVDMNQLNNVDYSTRQFLEQQTNVVNTLLNQSTTIDGADEVPADPFHVNFPPPIRKKSASKRKLSHDVDESSCDELPSKIRHVEDETRSR